MTRNLAVAMAVTLAACGGQHSTSESLADANWRIDSIPEFDVGGGRQDTLDIFGGVMGATRIHSGDIVVADRSVHALRYYSPNGQFDRAVGRQGDGPGEFQMILHLWRCGDTLFVRDWNAPHVFVFTEAGQYIRTNTLEPPEAGQTPYQSECNAGGTFVSFGWEQAHDSKVGLFRPTVPYWLSDATGAVTASLGHHPGGERLGVAVDGQLRGSGPMPLGRQSLVAIGTHRAYIGTADSFAIDVYTLDGTPAGMVHKPHVDLRTTPDDIARFVMLDTMGETPNRQASKLRELASVNYPTTVPAYSDMRVDAADNLWVERYPRAGATAARWVIFSPTGTEIGRVDLPLDFTVKEIGSDYVLGVARVPPDDVQHVQMYRLMRGEAGQ